MVTNRMPNTWEVENTQPFQDSAGLPLQITFRRMYPSEFVTRRIRSEMSKLNRHFQRITSCRVIVEAPHRHHRHGANYRVEIELAVPRAQIVITRTPNIRRALAHSEADQKWAKHLEVGTARKDLYNTIHDIFKCAQRRLENYARRLRGDVKIHARTPAGRRAKLAA